MCGFGGLDSVYIAAYTVVNEWKMVIHLMWTKGSGYVELTEGFQELKANNTTGAFELCYVDKCCGMGSFGAAIRDQFPDIDVKLDLFHGVKRVSHPLNKRDSLHWQFRIELSRAHWKYLMGVDDSLLVSQVAQDAREIPEPGVLVPQLLAVIAKYPDLCGTFPADWKSFGASGVPQLIAGSNPLLTAALQRHLHHAASYCLSDPKNIKMWFKNAAGDVLTHRGSVKNEALHKLLKEVCAKAARCGVTYVAALQRAVVYAWNATHFALKPTNSSNSNTATTTPAAPPVWLSQTTLPLLDYTSQLFQDTFASFSNPFGVYLLPDYKNIRGIKFTPFDKYAHNNNDTDPLLDYALTLVREHRAAIVTTGEENILPTILPAKDSPFNWGWLKQTAIYSVADGETFFSIIMNAVARCAHNGSPINSETFKTMLIEHVVTLNFKTYGNVWPSLAKSKESVLAVFDTPLSSVKASIVLRTTLMFCMTILASVFCRRVAVLYKFGHVVLIKSMFASGAPTFVFCAT